MEGVVDPVVVEVEDLVAVEEADPAAVEVVGRAARRRTTSVERARLLGARG